MTTDKKWHKICVKVRRDGLLCKDGLQRGNGWCEFLLRITEPTEEHPHENAAYICVKEFEGMFFDINKGGTAGFRSLRDWNSGFHPFVFVTRVL